MPQPHLVLHILVDQEPAAMWYASPDQVSGRPVQLKKKMAAWEKYEDAKRDADDGFNYFNTERYQWQLAKLSPSHSCQSAES